MKSTAQKAPIIVVIFSAVKQQKLYLYFSATLFVAVTSALLFYVELYLPSLPIDRASVAEARFWLVSKGTDYYYDYLVEQQAWQMYEIGDLLRTLTLAQKERLHFNVNSDSIYRDFVLCPHVDSYGSYDVCWRPALHDYFAPLVREIHVRSQAFEIINNSLALKIGIDASYGDHVGVETAWRQRVASRIGRQILLVAACRSVGIPSRLNQRNKAEYLDGERWVEAEEPTLAEI